MTCNRSRFPCGRLFGMNRINLKQGMRRVSEYQFYEFRAVDRLLGKSDIAALSRISSRAEFTPTGFAIEYNWSDLRADPEKLMAHWFDLHLYVAIWGTRRLMIRLPKRFINRSQVQDFDRECEYLKVIDAGENLVLDICDSDEDSEFSYEIDTTGLLGRLAPLREELLLGDLRLLYLVWLTKVNRNILDDDEPEPLDGIGPLSDGLKAFADFFDIDIDLVQAAAEVTSNVIDGEPNSETVKAAVEAIPEGEKTEILHRLVQGDDPHVLVELRRQIRKILAPADGTKRPEFRTVSELRSRAAEISRMRKAAVQERLQAESARREREVEEARKVRVKALRKRGDAVWDDVELEIERRNSSSYEQAIDLLIDLQWLAKENGTMNQFKIRLSRIRARHARKRRFIELLGRLYRFP